MCPSVKRFSFFSFFDLTKWHEGIIVPWPGIKPMPKVVGARSANRWNTREAPGAAWVTQVRRASLVAQNKPSHTWAYANEAALGGGGWLPAEPTTWLEGWPFPSTPSLHGGQRGRGLSCYRRPGIYSVWPNGSSRETVNEGVLRASRVRKPAPKLGACCPQTPRRQTLLPWGPSRISRVLSSCGCLPLEDKQ